MTIRMNVEKCIRLFQIILKSEINPEEVISNPDLQTLSSKIIERKNLLKSQSRTSKLGLMYLNIVDIAKSLISAERSGNFELALFVS